jgi:hypothetical protein
VPVDPYTGRALLYIVDAEGATVYATGPDKADDDDAVSGQREVPGLDLGFRLWNPNLRRASAVPATEPD